MTDKYDALKTAWRRFVQWERVFFLREKEWRFQIHGSVEGFEQRFKRSVPEVSREEFFRLYKKRKNPRVFGFHIGAELALKVPNQRTENATHKGIQWRRSVHYFHGILTHNDNDLCLFGHYRLPRKRADQVLGAINGGVFSSLLAIFFVFLWMNAEFLLSILPISFLVPIPILAAALMIAMMTAVICLVMAIPGLVITRLLDRNARADTHRLLEEICGKPEEEPAE